MDTEIEPECCLAYYENFNTVKNRMADIQERIFPQEKPKKEAQDLRSLVTTS